MKMNTVNKTLYPSLDASIGYLDYLFTLFMETVVFVSFVLFSRGSTFPGEQLR